MKKILTIVLFAILLIGCTDPYKLQTNTFDEALVIEATITNEMKRQEIKISKTYRLEEDGPSPVTDANVTISDDIGNSYTFSEEDGVYFSDTEFEATPGRSYTLNVTTPDGKSYSSTAEKLTTVSPITSITASAATVRNQKGVQIGVNSFDPTGTSQYYRYTYSETYKVVSPMTVDVYALVNHDWNPVLSSDDIIELLERTYEAETCYNTIASDQILVATTSDQSEDHVQNFPVRFIAATNDIIKHRYSINVKQYVQTFEAYTFYKTLSQMSGNNGNILSQNQPGFFSGNIFSDSDPEEKIIGFFEVSSVSEERIFFNFNEVLPGEIPPGFFVNCDFIVLNADDFARDSNQGTILRNAIEQGSLLYYSHAGSLYNMVPKECGDCTTFSSNIVPPFWID